MRMLQTPAGSLNILRSFRLRWKCVCSHADRCQEMSRKVKGYAACVYVEYWNLLIDDQLSVAAQRAPCICLKHSTHSTVSTEGHMSTGTEQVRLHTQDTLTLAPCWDEMCRFIRLSTPQTVCFQNKVLWHSALCNYTVIDSATLIMEPLCSTRSSEQDLSMQL